MDYTRGGPDHASGGAHGATRHSGHHPASRRTPARSPKAMCKPNRSAPMRVAGLERARCEAYRADRRRPGAHPIASARLGRARRSFGGPLRRVERMSCKPCDQALAAAAKGRSVVIVGGSRASANRAYSMSSCTRTAPKAGSCCEAGSVSYGKATGYRPRHRPAEKLLRGRRTRRPEESARARSPANCSRSTEASSHNCNALLALLEVPARRHALGRARPGSTRRAIQDAVKRLLLRESQAQPLMLVVRRPALGRRRDARPCSTHSSKAFPPPGCCCSSTTAPKCGHGWGQQDATAGSCGWTRCRAEIGRRTA